MVEHLKKYTLLIAEDEPNTLSEITQYFGHYFRLVFQAKDGTQALEVFKKESPDVVILDISMPYMSGLQVAEKINQINQNTQIVILSAHNEQSILLQAIEMDLFKFIVKPLNRKNAMQLLIDVNAHFQDVSQFVINSEMRYHYGHKSIILRDEIWIKLTKKEMLLIEYLIKRKNQITNIDELVNIMYDDNTTADYRARIKVLISSLKKKLPALPLKNQYGIGYVLEIKDGIT